MRKRIVIAVVLAGLFSQSMAVSVVNDSPLIVAASDKVPSETDSQISLSLFGQPYDNRKSELTSYECRVSSLETTSRGLKPAKVDADYEDLELLARAIYAEARGESFLGQVAVGAVIINRTLDKRFPSSIREVIYQPGALCTVKDGQINLKPGEIARRAALLALSGFDPTGGSLYFFNPNYATAQWTKKKTIIRQIGNHSFTR